MKKQLLGRKIPATVALGLVLAVPGLANADVKFNFTTIDYPNSSRTAGYLIPSLRTQAPATNARSSSFFGLANTTLSFTLLCICHTSDGCASVMYTARKLTLPWYWS